MVGDAQHRSARARWGLVLQALVLAVVAFLSFAHRPQQAGVRWIDPLHPFMAEARRKAAVRSDDDFYRMILGGDYPILERVQADYPPGTRISVPFEDSYRHRVLQRVTRMWLALLPDYPISSEAQLVICPRRRCGTRPGDAVVESGELLALVQRGPE